MANSGFKIPDKIGFETPIYIHSHASTFLECLAEQNYKQGINNFFGELQKIQYRSLEYLEKGAGLLSETTKECQKYIDLKNGNDKIKLIQDTKFGELLKQIINLSNYLGQGYQRSVLPLEKFDVNLKDKLEDIINQAVQDEINNLSDEDLRTYYNGDTIDEVVKKITTKRKKGVEKEWGSINYNLSIEQLYKTTMQELQTKDKRRKVTKKMMTALANNVTPKLNNIFYINVKKQWEEIRKALDELLESVNDISSDQSYELIRQKIDEIEKSPIYSRIGKLWELLSLHQEYQKISFITKFNDMNISEEFVGDLNKQKGKGYLNDLVTDVNLILQKNGMTEPFTVGISVKKTTFGESIFSVAGAMKNKQLVTSSEYDNIFNNLTPEEQNSILYIISNYEALKRFNVNTGTDYEHITPYTLTDYDFISQMQYAFAGYNAIRSLIGPILLYSEGSLEDRLKRTIESKGLPIILSNNMRVYWTETILRNIYSIISNNIDGYIRIEQQGNILKNIFKRDALMAVYEKKRYAASQQENLDRNDRLLFYYDLVRQYVIRVPQLDMGKLKTVVLNSGRLTFDAEKVYNME